MIKIGERAFVGKPLHGVTIYKRTINGTDYYFTVRKSSITVTNPSDTSTFRILIHRIPR